MKNFLAIGLTFFTLTLSLSAQAASVSGKGTWETTLQSRDVNNDSVIDAYYDTVLDITWLADANYVATSGYDTDNRMTWDEAQGWIDTLNLSGFLGMNNWRLPQVMENGPAGCDFSYDGTDCGWNPDTSTGEMASLFYDTLGNIAYFDRDGNTPQAGWDADMNIGPFSDVQFYYHWADTEHVIDSGEAWYTHLGFGTQNATDKTLERSAWAVMDGDIGASVVPVPAAVWLFGSALAGLGWFRRKKTA